MPATDSLTVQNYSETIPLNRDPIVPLSTSENHALTYVMMCLEGDSYSRKDLSKLFVASQGPEPAWEPAPNLNFSYATDKFVFAGLAKLANEPRKVPGHKLPLDVLVVRPVISQDALATAGVLLDWSLSEPTLGLRDVFGRSNETHSKADNAVIRKRIFEILLMNPRTSETELAQDIDPGNREVGKILRKLCAQGILVVDNASNWENRKVGLNGRELLQTKNQREKLRPETIAIYDTVEAMIADGIAETTPDAIYDRVIATLPEIDPDLVRQAIAQSLVISKGRSKFIPAITSSGAFNSGKKTKYDIDESYKESLSRLVHGLNLVENGDREVITYFSDRAVDIYTDPQNVVALVSKSKTLSAQKNLISDSEFINQVGEITAAEGSLTITALAKYLRQRGVRLSRAGLGGKIRLLEQTGVVTTVTGRVHKRNATPVKYITGINK